MDPETLTGIKALLDTWRAALGFLKDARDLLPESAEKEAAGRALVEAENAASIAQAEIAQALGYELCRCEFPPTPMLQVGYRSLHDGTMNSAPVYECPKCQQNNAGPWSWSRKVPERGG